MRSFLKRSAVTIAGGAVVAVGIALMVLPGPGLLVVVAGLAILATEYAWARSLLDATRSRAEQVAAAAVSSKRNLAGSVAAGLVALAGGIVLLVLMPRLPFLADVGVGPTAAGVGGVVAGVVILTSVVVQVRQARAILDQSASDG